MSKGRVASNMAETPKADANINESAKDAAYKCMRNPADGSMYYGEVAYIRRSNGQLVKSNAAAYETELKTLSEEERRS